jgi:tRNA uridine 5-carboxymethylaminomethyl modification enzyme
VLNNGTFLNGLIHIGKNNLRRKSRREVLHGVTEDLIAAGFESGRMKTGTPPRVDGRSLDYSKMNEKKEMPSRISFPIQMTSPLVHQRSCHMTYTSLEVHDILKVLIVRQCLTGE